MAETVKQRILTDAANRIGVDYLARHLRSPESLVQAWMRGQATMPDRKFLALVDLLDSMEEGG